MKTKHLVAMALPLVFTACSQEELVTENNQSVASNRKVVENVVIKFNDAAESRLAFDDLKYKWENGDKFGACLMDQLTNPIDMDEWNWTQWFGQFTLVDYIQSNYPFTRQDNGSWTNAEAVMQEGNYFFYYPFNSNMGGKRTAIRMNVPTELYVTDGKETYDVLGDQMFLAYSPIVADPSKEGHETITNITMEPLLAFPAFNIENATGYDFTISRIAIGGEDGGKTVNFPTVLTVDPTSNGKFNNVDFVTNSNWTDVNRRAEVLDIVNKSNVEGETTTKVNVTFGEKGKLLGSGKNFTSYIMLPPLNVLDNNNDGKLDDLNLYIYTNKGLVTVPLSMDKDGDDIKIQNFLTSYEYNDGFISYIKLDEKAFETPGEINVNSTRDLEDLVVWNKNTQGEISATITRDVTLTKKIYDVLAVNDKLKLTLKGDAVNDVKVTIPVDAPANAIDRINFNAPANINLINEGVITVSKNFTTFKSLTNNGTLSIATSITLNGKTLANNGTLTFDKKDITFEGNFSNKGVVTVTANVSGFDVNNLGQFTINEGVECKKIYVENQYTTDPELTYGTLNVNGKMIAGSIINNHGTVVVGNKGEINAAGQNVKEEYVVNNILLYASSIQNSGVISGVTNLGTIVMETKEAQLNSNSSSTGYIQNNACANVKAQTGETIFVEFSGETKASEISKIVSESNAKVVKLQGNVTIDPSEKNNKVEVVGRNSLTIKTVGVLTFKASSSENVELGFKNYNGTYANAFFNEGSTKVCDYVTLSVGYVIGANITVDNYANVWADNKPNGLTNVYGKWNER